MKPSDTPMNVPQEKGAPRPGPGMWLRLASPLAGLVFFGMALWSLQHSLQAYRYEDVVGALAEMSPSRLTPALGLTVAAYLVLIGYDILALRFIRQGVALRGVVAASLISNALGSNLGNILITGTAVRYWIYTSLGLSATQIARVVLFCSLGFWLGYLFLCSTLLAFWPVSWPAALHWIEALARPVGILILITLGAYLGWTARGRRLKLRGWRFDMPSPGLTLGQILVASVDLCLMAAVLYVLLPSATGMDFAHFLPMFCIALISGSLSQVPGGLGVFETAMFLLLSPQVDARELAAALLAFRAIYYLLPLFLAVAFVALREGWGRGARLRGAWVRGERWLGGLAPQTLAAVTFVSGTVLLFSGAVPAASGRLAQIHQLVTLPIIEISHFVASLVGATLLLLARGLQRRLDAAWLLAVILLATGSVLSLIKGWDFEEATILGVASLACLPFHQQFYRRSSLLGGPFSAAWAVSIVIVLGGTAWLLSFAYTHFSDAAEPWWQFGLEAEASRSLRATTAAVGLTVLFALRQLIKPVDRSPPPPASNDIERARPLVKKSPRTYANLVFRGDKSLLFSQSGDAFLMYGRRGRSWIAMGDPIGPEEEVRELVWRFRELADRFDGWCVFFEVGEERRDLYAELGLSLTPLGEEARVDLGAFGLDGRKYKGLRQARTRALRQGCTFEILPRSAVPAVIPEVARVSDAWLACKSGCEKGFSNASFDPEYLANFPLAVVRQGGEIIAFSNLWLGAGKEELSIDLMRHLPLAPNGTMDLLFTELMWWGKAEGYRWFTFGMSPLAGLEGQGGAPLWNRVGTFLYRHGERFYNFHGLRHYKGKFHPAWRTLYLASPGGLALGPVLLDVTALMAGSLSGIVSKKPSLIRSRA